MDQYALWNVISTEQIPVKVRVGGPRSRLRNISGVEVVYDADGNKTKVIIVCSDSDAELT